MRPLNPSRPLTRGMRRALLCTAMSRRSAGILMYKHENGALEVLLVHPGGPFWRNKDLGAWSIPKGEHGAAEDALAVARREFAEETGVPVSGDFRFLGELRQPGGKIVAAWAVEGELAAETISSNMFEIEWPPRSGRTQAFPEIDRAAWFFVAEARQKILRGQAEFIDRLIEMLRRRDD